MKITESKLRKIIRSVIKESSMNEMIDMMNFGTSHEAGRHGTLSDHEFLKANFEASKAESYVNDVKNMLNALGVGGGSVAPIAATIVAMTTSPLLGIAVGVGLSVGAVICIAVSKLIEISSGSSGDKHVDAYMELLDQLEDAGYSNK